MRVGNKLFSVEIDPLVFATASEEQLRQLRRNFPCFRLKKTGEETMKKPFEISEDVLSKSNSFRKIADEMKLNETSSTELVEMITKKKDMYTSWFRGMIRLVLGERLVYEESTTTVDAWRAESIEHSKRVQEMIHLAARTALGLNELEFPGLEHRLRQAGVAVSLGASDVERRRVMVATLTLIELRKGQFKDLLSPGNETA